MRLLEKIANIGGTGSPDNEEQEQLFRKYTVWMWGGFLSVMVFLVLLFAGVSSGLFGSLPTFVELESPRNELASEIYAADGSLLGKFFIVDRSNAHYENLPQHLVDALIVTEDVRFYHHSGIDFRGILRVFYKTILMGEKSGGGSTITQQLAKNLFHDPPKNALERFKQKLKEWIIALKLERSYTKQEILTMYLNTVPFGNNAHGIKTASQVYFSTPLDSLNIQQASVLVGMLKGSTIYNPRKNPENSKTRRNTVLGQLYSYGKLSQRELDSLSAMPLGTKFNLPEYGGGLAPHFRDFVRSELKKWFKENLKIDGTSYDIYRDGLRIYTTIDPQMQLYAEQAVAEHMGDLQRQFYDHWKGQGDPWRNAPNANVPPNDPWYGTNDVIYRGVKNSERYESMKELGLSEQEIKNAFVKPVKMRLFRWKTATEVRKELQEEGYTDEQAKKILAKPIAHKSIVWQTERDTTISPLDSVKYVKFLLQTGFIATDPATGYILSYVGGTDYKYFKYDNARPTSRRQVGSTFKPFVYAEAIEHGWSPCRRVPNMRVTIGDWSPDNSSSYMAGEMVSLKTGLAHSINRVTAYLIKEIGADAVLDLVRKMGIDEEQKIKPEPGICLGTPDLSVYDMVGAYGTFADKGFYSKPLFITRIEDKNGNVVRSFVPNRTEVMSEQKAYAMINLLKGVTDFGTARRIRSRYGITAEVAGKTGTTNDNSDGWYIGMVPKVVAGAWVGGDEKVIHFRNTQLGGGANMALPIFAKFMLKVYADTSLHISQNDRFEVPQNMDVELDCSKYETSDSGGAGNSNAPTIIVSASGDTIVIPSTPTAPATDTAKKEFDYNNQFD